MPKRASPQWAVKVPLGLVEGLQRPGLNTETGESPSYEEEFEIKKQHVIEWFSPFVDGDKSRFCFSHKSPAEHYRFRTCVSVLREQDLRGLRENESGRCWLNCVLNEAWSERRKVEEAAAGGIVMGKRFGYFMLVDGGTNGTGTPSVAVTQPERTPLESLSRGICDLLRDAEFLRRLGDSKFLKLGLSCMKLHSTVAYENQFSTEWKAAVAREEETLAKTCAGADNEGPLQRGGPCGLVCGFIFDTDVLLVEAGKDLGDSSSMAEQPEAKPLLDRLLVPALAGLSDAFPRVLFRLQARELLVTSFGSEGVKTALGKFWQDSPRGEEAVATPSSLASRSVLLEQLQVGSRTCRYKQVFDSFSNPNPHIAVATGLWLSEQVKKWSSARKEGNAGANMLELYCGVGSHSVVLGPAFRSIVAVDINKNLVAMLEENVRLNPDLRLRREGDGLEADERTQVFPVCAPSSGFCRMVMKTRRYAGLSFDWLLLDPPREGLDPLTLRLASSFSHVLYVSCNPAALQRDLGALLEGGELECRGLCMLDHFPFSAHVENAVCLTRKGERLE